MTVVQVPMAKETMERGIQVRKALEMLDEELWLLAKTTSRVAELLRRLVSE